VRHALLRGGGTLTSGGTDDQEEQADGLPPDRGDARWLHTRSGEGRNVLQPRISGAITMSFSCRHRDPLDRHNVIRNFQKLLTLLDLTRLPPYLRHACASLHFAQWLTPKAT
jgi:hypothetical protein